jgi:hypothetical protein
MTTLDSFVRKPEVIKLEITDEEIVKDFGGEPIVFYMKDTISISNYFSYVKAQAEGDADKLEEAMRSIILKEDGTPVLKEGESLPVQLAIAVLTKVNDYMGKSNAK